MTTSEVIIPTLLCAMGVLVFNSKRGTYDSESIRLRSEKRVRTFPDRTQVHSRLTQLGREGEYANFRIKQISNSLIGAVGVFLAALLASGSAPLATLFAGLVGAGIYYLVDHRLSREVTRHRLVIESEFASIVEMLTLSLSAGETPLCAMTRISQRSHGVLAFEFSSVIESVRNGVSFHESLDALGRRVDSVVIRRFVDSLVTAMLRGAPLIEVLQRHAAEARQNQRNILMDKAGKAEVSMMVPVVFLILPISILFALWPSLTHLNLFAA